MDGHRSLNHRILLNLQEIAFKNQFCYTDDISLISKRLVAELRVLNRVTFYISEGHGTIVFSCNSRGEIQVINYQKNEIDNTQGWPRLAGEELLEDKLNKKLLLLL